MAISIRYGANGSYKTACAVWYDLLPALREGRTVVTNIQGILSVKDIEKNLGEKFPDTARVIKIYSLTESGRYMWQNFYNWMPMGAAIFIDEMQNIFNKTVGFDMAKNTYQGIEPFLDSLPEWYKEFYDENRATYVPDESDLDVDDTGESLYDENGLVRLPPTFEESMSRHRHFNWDIIFITPSITNISTDIRGCAEVAVQHKSKDSMGFIGKRKPRIYEHDPKMNTTTPPKDAVMYRKKVPVEVHLLYKSTVTGKTGQSGAGANPLLSFKFLSIAALGLIFTIGSIWQFYGILTRDSKAPLSAQETASPGVQTDNLGAQTRSHNSSQAEGVQTHTVSGDSSGHVRTDKHSVAFDAPVFHHGDLESPPPIWPYPVDTLYVSGIQVRVDSPHVYTTIVFKQVYEDGREGYVYDDLLTKLGYQVKALDHCLVKLTYQSQSKIVSCDSRPTQHDLSLYEDESQYANTTISETIETNSVLPMGG